MKSWWENLSSNERIWVLAGGSLAAVFLVYLLLWQPLSSSVSDLQTSVAEQRQLLVWMSDVAPRIQHLSSSVTSTQQRTVTQTELLSVIDQSLKDQKLNRFANNISQAENGKVQIKFTEVGFDPLVDWLSLIWRQYTIKVAQINLKPLPKPGAVEAEIDLETISQ